MTTSALQLRLWDSQAPAFTEEKSRGGGPPAAARAEEGTEQRIARAAARADAGAPDVGRGGESARRAVVSELRRRVRQVEAGGRPRAATISTGVAALDRMLPGGGLPPGALSEWVGTSAASGAGWLAWSAACRAAAQARGAVVVLDPAGTFYPPAALAAGLPAERILLVRPGRADDAVWAADQALRCRSVAALWGALPRLDDRQARRLQLAAEAGGTLGLLVRSVEALRQPSWAEVRWRIRPLAGRRGRRLEARLVRCRGGRSGAAVVLEIDPRDGTARAEGGSCDAPESAVPLAARLARPAVAERGGRRIRSA